MIGVKFEDGTVYWDGESWHSDSDVANKSTDMSEYMDAMTPTGADFMTLIVLANKSAKLYGGEAIIPDVEFDPDVIY